MAPLIVTALAGEKRREAEARAERARLVREAKRARARRVIRLPEPAGRVVALDDKEPARTT